MIFWKINRMYSSSLCLKILIAIPIDPKFACFLLPFSRIRKKWKCNIYLYFMCMFWIHFLDYFGIPHSVPLPESRPRYAGIRPVSRSKRYSSSAILSDKSLPHHSFVFSWKFIQIKNMALLRIILGCFLILVFLREIYFCESIILKWSDTSNCFYNCIRYFKIWMINRDNGRRQFSAILIM